MTDSGNNQYLAMLGDTYPFNLFQPECVGSTIFPPHWHNDCLELIYVRQGQVELHIGGRSFIGQAGDLVLIGEGVIHSGYVVDTPPDYYTILLDRSRLASSDFMNVASRSMLTGKLRLPVLLQTGDDGYTNCITIIRSIIEEYVARSAGFELAIKSYLHVLLLVLAREYGESADGEDVRGEAAKRRMERLKDAISYIEARYSDKLTVGEAARAAGMSPYHFCRVFKHAVGRTFTEYIHLYRIGKAEVLIRDTDLPITRIAEQTGFGTIQYLDELFKRYRGCTPMQLRRSPAPSSADPNNKKM
ncbi:helix-turn-helix transcriptional regulator [Cohnella sp. LGH]|uniref:helix-turn-helix domain-containing protein n=1 Tax=Cohnella sp. LGH TaxID=1619153 RepID=UPI001ADA1F4F|nr:helix-turn-helix domain-containing protein [Cohnella sp. LGH]QTH43110.1 helix-turn-helix transcriptional regulator [Cohnella sp. LGH]